MKLMITIIFLVLTACGVLSGTANLNKEEVIEIIKEEKGKVNDVYIWEVKHQKDKYIVTYIYSGKGFGYVVEVNDTTGEIINTLLEIKVNRQ